MRLWRISNYADLSGIGGLQASGRWHNKGKLIIYAAEHPAGAMLEMLVHVNWATLPKTFQLIAMDAAEPTTVDSTELPPNWMNDEQQCRNIGDAWLQAKSSLLRRVPSAILPDTFNYLINPLHPQIASLKIHKANKIPLDPRLARN